MKYLKLVTWQYEQPIIFFKANRFLTIYLALDDNFDCYAIKDEMLGSCAHYFTTW
jgi:hypothetical protein